MSHTPRLLTTRRRLTVRSVVFLPVLFLPVVFLTTIGLTSIGLSTISTGAEDFSDQLPRIAPTDPADSLSGFKVAEGFEIQLVASEPLIGSPVAIEWDASGALFVCEMRGYSENRDDAISRISRLTDVDGDGVFDRRTVFADGLLWPTALFPYDGGLFVADAPHIYYFKDTDDDGVADDKKVALTGFSTGNVQGLLNSFRWGLDNRIHLACGTVGGKVRRADQGESEAVEVRGHDLAFDPRTYAFTLTSGGAQHGMCFDDWGRKFVSSNSDHLQQVMYEDRYIARNPLLSAPSSRQSIAADGPQAEVFRISPVEPWRIVRTRLRVAGLVRGPIEGGGRAAGYFTGATGVTIYRGDAWPKAFQGLAIVGDVGSNLVHRKRLSADGVMFVGNRIDEQSEFVVSKDNWFRPAQFACGPDGALSIVDVYREVIEHPKSLPPDIKRHLDLTSGRDRGRIYRVVPTGYVQRSTPDLARAKTASLVNVLQHPNAWHRETAARLIFERQDPSIETALRKQSRESDSPLGRLHSLYALDGLGRLHRDDVIAALIDSDPQVVRHAIRFAESFDSDPAIVKAIEPLLRHPAVDVRYQLAFSIGEIKPMRRFHWLAKLVAQNPGDRWIQTAVASSAGDAPEQLLVQLLDSESVETLAPFLNELAKQVDRKNDNEARRNALVAISQSRPDPSLLPTIGSLLRRIDRSKVDAALLDQVRSTESKLLAEAIKRIRQVDRTDDQRIEAIGWAKNARTQDLANALLDAIRSSDSSSLQIAAMNALGRFDDPAITDLLIEGWPAWSPRLRAAAGDVLFSDGKRSAAVLDAIDQERIDPGDIPLTRWQTMASGRNQMLSRRAKKILDGMSNPSRELVIKQYQPALELAGDLTRGAEVFKKQCAGCHQVRGVGHEIGPNLAAAATRGGESILTNVLDPNREVNPQYINYTVLTLNGKTVTGMIASENANSVTLRRAEAVTETVLRRDIDLIRNTNQSIMPEGLEKAIPPQAMADLIAYLVDASRSISD